MAVGTGLKGTCLLAYRQNELVHLPEFHKMHKTMAFGLFLFCIIFLTIEDIEGNRIPPHCLVGVKNNMPVNCNDLVYSDHFVIIEF